jgi:hypothetical protein
LEKVIHGLHTAYEVGGPVALIGAIIGGLAAIWVAGISVMVNQDPFCRVACVQSFNWVALPEMLATGLVGIIIGGLAGWALSSATGWGNVE